MTRGARRCRDASATHATIGDSDHIRYALIQQFLEASCFLLPACLDSLQAQPFSRPCDTVRVDVQVRVIDPRMIAFNIFKERLPCLVFHRRAWQPMATITAPLVTRVYPLSTVIPASLINGFSYPEITSLL